MNRIENCTPAMLRRLADHLEGPHHQGPGPLRIVHLETSTNIPLYAVVEPAPVFTEWVD